MGKIVAGACEGARDYIVRYGNFLIARTPNAIRDPDTRLRSNVPMSSGRQFPANKNDRSFVALDRPARSGSETSAMRNNTSAKIGRNCKA